MTYLKSQRLGGQVEKSEFIKITKRYRKNLKLSQARFGDALTSKMANWTLTRQAVSNWERGKTEPFIDELLWVMLIYSDWRMEWAIDAICAKMPEAFYRDKYGLSVKSGKTEKVAA